MSRVLIIISLFFWTKSFSQTIYHVGSSGDSLIISLQQEELEIIHSKKNQSLKNSKGKIEIERCSGVQKKITLSNLKGEQFEILVGKLNLVIFNEDSIAFSTKDPQLDEDLRINYEPIERYDTLIVPSTIMKNSFLIFRYFKRRLTSIVVLTDAGYFEHSIFENRRGIPYISILKLSTFNENYRISYTPKSTIGISIMSTKNNDGANVEFRNSGNPRAVYIHRNIGRDNYLLKKVLHINFFKKVNYNTIILQGE